PGSRAPARPLPLRAAAHPQARRVRRLHVRARPPVRGRALALATPAVALTGGGVFFLLKTRQLAGSVGLEAFPLADASLHTQVALHLAQGHGFAYNPGGSGRGSTPSLWTLVLAGAF